MPEDKLSANDTQLNKFIESLRTKVKKYKKTISVMNRQAAVAKNRQLFLQEAMVERNARLQEYAKMVEMKASEVLQSL